MRTGTDPNGDVAAPRGVILVADDEPGMRSALREVLRRSGWRVEAVECGAQALARLAEDDAVDLLLTDFRMPGMSGLELLREARAQRPALPVIMMTAFGTVEDAVAAMRDGAADYLMKPFSFDTVTQTVERVMAERLDPPRTPTGRPAETATPVLPAARGGNIHARVIAESPSLRALLEVAADVAEADSTVMLSGESGTGKEVVARFIHECSNSKGPFVAINCAALPEGLLESELFGHEKGAFTGAVLARKGRFEQANGGTLLLDEISEMPLALQAKLLRVLQEREITPIGANETIRLDVRVIATTNRDLRQEVMEHRFRQDLYYRLNVIALDIPPLRNRREDILPLAEYFLARYRRKNRPAQRLGADVRRYLLDCEWPGNVRELENLIERACLLARGTEITLADLHLGPARQSTPAGAMPFPFGDDCLTLEELERRLITHTLERTGGNRTRTADLLGVSVRTIRNKIHQYGLVEAAG